MDSLEARSLNSRCQQGWLPFGGLQQKACSLPLLASGVAGHSGVPGPVDASPQSLPLLSRGRLSGCHCAWVSSFKDTSHIGLRSILMASSSLDHGYKDPIFK